MYEELNIYRVVQKLIGPIHPIGDGGEDARRLDHLAQHRALVEDLLHDLAHAASYRHRHEGSMNDVGREAFAGLKDCMQIISEVLEAPNETTD